jgi:hypothetical protein
VAVNDPKNSLLSLLYNVAFGDQVRAEFHRNPSQVAKDYKPDAVQAIVDFGEARKHNQGAEAIGALTDLLGKEILAGDAVGVPYKIW